eukprot:1058125-Amphidinium_carterae.1
MPNIGLDKHPRVLQRIVHGRTLCLNKGRSSSSWRVLESFWSYKDVLWQIAECNNVSLSLKQSCAQVCVCIIVISKETVKYAARILKDFPPMAILCEGHSKVGAPAKDSDKCGLQASLQKVQS